MTFFQALQISWLANVALVLILYVAAVVVRRVFFSRLSKFPGPKLAAATFLYEIYYEIFRQGQYTFKIKELHKKYGKKPPILELELIY